MAKPPESIIKEREELMVSPSGCNIPILRTAHFLKPSATFNDEPVLELPSFSRSPLPPIFEPTEWPIKVSFNGWRKCPPKNWRNWVDFLHSKYEAVWKEAGIYEAIINSTFEIQRDENLVFGIAERWSPETKSFHFPWAEATITLEDVMVMGGYSVLGDPFFSPLENPLLKEKERELNRARLEVWRRNSRNINQVPWMRMFKESGSEIEHEAFLVFWLSMFVFADSRIIKKLLFPIAIHLARGKRIALARAVLASIYRDLSGLKEAIVESTQFCNGKNPKFVLQVKLWSPLQLLQLWALERFRAPQPQNNFTSGDPFFARWHKVKKLTLGNVRLAIDSAGDTFQWRPYTTDVFNWYGSKLFGDKAMWVSIGPSLNEQQEAFATCLRVSKLVGVNCTEKYLPHRVAMQFGMDQDLPARVVQCNERPEGCNGPIGGVKLYIPPRHFEAGVTARYLEWRKKSFNLQDAVKGTVKRQRSKGLRRQRGLKMDKAVQKTLKEEDGDNNADVPPGFPRKCNTLSKAGISVKEEPTVVEMMSSDYMDCRLDNLAVYDSKNLGHPQSFSASTADAGENKLLTESVEKITQSISSMGGLKRTMNIDENERNAGNQDYGRVRIGGCKRGAIIQVHEMSWFELEARVIRLERDVAELQAETFGQTRHSLSI